jgi:hypothetical protein
MSTDAVHKLDSAELNALVPWLIVAPLTAILTLLTTIQSLARYDALDSGWSWDLAYYNQWFWAITNGDGILSVRPLSAYATEGPSVWKMNYLAPVRLLLVPIYALAPDPRILLVIQNVVFWWVIPAAYTLARSECQSRWLAISAVLLVPTLPLFWPLVWNDFRELQLAAPFVLWAIQGVRGRSVGLTAFGVAGMLACRQEFAIMVATFAIIPPRQPESLSTTLAWRRTLVLVGSVWVIFGFFGYLRLMIGPGTPTAFIDQFSGPRAGLGETLVTAAEVLLLGMGGWALFAFSGPRLALVAVPWIWALCNGRWALRMLDGADWHHVRYTVPMVVTLLAAGLVNYAVLGQKLLRRRRGWIVLAVIWALAAAMNLFGLWNLETRIANVPNTFSADEAAEVWKWIRQVDPDDAVLADYAVTAPLSSRKQLYSYVMDQNLPKGFPTLGPEFRWLFVKNDYPLLGSLLDQGFQTVYTCRFLTVARRSGSPK